MLCWDGDVDRIPVVAGGATAARSRAKGGAAECQSWIEGGPPWVCENHYHHHHLRTIATSKGVVLVCEIKYIL